MRGLAREIKEALKEAGKEEHRMKTDTEDTTKGTDQSVCARVVGKLWRRRNKSCAGQAAEPIKRLHCSLTLGAKRNIRTPARTQNGTLRSLSERL
jgi:hypothetical protein